MDDGGKVNVVFLIVISVLKIWLEKNYIRCNSEVMKVDVEDWIGMILEDMDL